MGAVSETLRGTIIYICTSQMKRCDGERGKEGSRKGERKKAEGGEGEGFEIEVGGNNEGPLPWDSLFWRYPSLNHQTREREKKVQN